MSSLFRIYQSIIVFYDNNMCIINQIIIFLVFIFMYVYTSMCVHMYFTCMLSASVYTPQQICGSQRTTSGAGHHVPSYFKQSLSLGLPLSRTILLPHKFWGTLPSTGAKSTQGTCLRVFSGFTPQVLMLAQQALYSLGCLRSHKICFISISHIF